MNLMQFLKKHVAPSDATALFTSDQFPLDDESITELAINAMLLVMNNAQRSTGVAKNTIDDYAPLVSCGVRFPWKNRLALAEEIDLINDEVPDRCVIGMTRNTTKSNLFAQTVYMSKINPEKLQKFKILKGAKEVFRVGFIEGLEGLNKKLYNTSSNDIESLVYPSYAGYTSDGICVGCSTTGVTDFIAARILAYIVGMYNDRRYFWNVTAKEEFWNGLPACAHYSVDKEYIKSLLYARSFPLTSKGRLRPILHWVQAHQRRLKEGVEIDVTKHLRGIDSFSMHDVNFEITSPKKSSNLAIQ